MIEPGEVLAGKYRIERVLGGGGMGVVLAAHHLQLDERVAIKLLLPEMLGNPDTVARFAREAQAAVKIKSEHVARVIDVSTLPNGAPYLVMEYLEGEDLSQWLDRRGALAIEQAVEFVLQACEALAEAHGLGIVHRDLKPANLFCIRRADGLLSVKVLDFGISKVTKMSGSGPEMGLTKTSAIMGSPLYMSPEQMHSAREVDARSDIWALGAILYELIARRTPFVGESYPELVLKVAGSAPDPITRFRPDLPPGLEPVILKCLEKNRQQRYQNIGELALALRDFAPKRARASVERVSRVISASGLSASAVALPPSSEHDQAQAAAGTNPSWGKTGAAPKRSRASLVALGAALVLVAVAGATWSLKRLSGEAPQQPSAAGAEPSSAPVTSAEPPPPTPQISPLGTLAEPVPSATSPEPSAAASASSRPRPERWLPLPRPTATAVATTTARTQTVTPDPKPSAKPASSLGGRL